MKKLIAKIKGIDPFYSEIKKNQVGLYQAYFERLLLSINVDNFTRRNSGEKYDNKVANQDGNIIEKIITKEAQIKDDLLPVYLQIILEQYFFADAWERETDKHNWVHRVMHRKRVDYFPDPMSVYSTLFE